LQFTSFMREREDNETRAEPVRAPQFHKQTAKPEPRQRLAHRFECDPDDPGIVRGLD
jgi:hypothetical protein